MAARNFCFAVGALYFLLGILGFNYPLLSAPEPRAGFENMVINDYYGQLLGMIPVNGPHNVLSILLGLLGIIAAISRVNSIRYCKFLFGLMLLVTIIGFAPG